MIPIMVEEANSNFPSQRGVSGDLLVERCGDSKTQSAATPVFSSTSCVTSNELSNEGELPISIVSFEERDKAMKEACKTSQEEVSQKTNDLADLLIFQEEPFDVPDWLFPSLLPSQDVKKIFEDLDCGTSQDSDYETSQEMDFSETPKVSQATKQDAEKISESSCGDLKRKQTQKLRDTFAIKRRTKNDTKDKDKVQKVISDLQWNFTKWEKLNEIAYIELRNKREEMYKCRKSFIKRKALEARQGWSSVLILNLKVQLRTKILEVSNAERIINMVKEKRDEAFLKDLVSEELTDVELPEQAIEELFASGSNYENLQEALNTPMKQRQSSQTKMMMKEIEKHTEKAAQKKILLFQQLNLKQWKKIYNQAQSRLKECKNAACKCRTTIFNNEKRPSKSLKKQKTQDRRCCASDLKEELRKKNLEIARMQGIVNMLKAKMLEELKAHQLASNQSVLLQEVHNTWALQFVPLLSASH